MYKAEQMQDAVESVSFMQLVRECQSRVRELFPWDLLDRMNSSNDILLLDVREPYEFGAMSIKGSVNVPRGILESACDYSYEETVPELVEARERDVVVICRSGYRSLLAADVMQKMGFSSVFSLKTGLRGWNDYEQELINDSGEVVEFEDADDYFVPKLRPEQEGPVS